MAAVPLLFLGSEEFPPQRCYHGDTATPNRFSPLIFNLRP